MWGARQEDLLKMHSQPLVLHRWLPRLSFANAMLIILQAGSRGVGRGIAQTKGHLVLILLAHFGFRVPPRQTPNACMLRLSAPGVNADGSLPLISQSMDFIAQAAY